MKYRTIGVALVTALLLGLFADLRPVSFVLAVSVITLVTMGVFSQLDSYLAAARSRLSRVVR